MWFEFKLALRFLRTGGTQTLMIMAGIIVGVAVQVFLGSLIGGLQVDLVNQTVGLSPHIFIRNEDALPRAISNHVEKNSRTVTFTGRELYLNNWQSLADKLKDNSQITAISPTISGVGIAQRGQRTKSVIFRGVDLEQANGIYQLSSRIIKGEPRLQGNNIMLGKVLAEDLELQPGDTLQLRTGGGVQDRFYLSAIFDLGSQELNESWIFMSLSRAGTLFNLGNDISVLEIQVDDVFAAREISAAISAKNQELSVENWKDNNAQLLTALQSQSSSSLLIQFFVIVAVTLGISSVLAVSVNQKSRQIGILKAMGTKKSRVGRIFLIQGGIIGAVGAFLGIFLGFGLTQVFVVFVTTETGDPLFPIELDFFFLIISFVIAISAGMIAALIPARSSARLNPIEVIQNG